jgi:hypothetical protein
MRLRFRLALVLGCAAMVSPMFAQTCANPRAPRVGVVIGENKTPKTPEGVKTLEIATKIQAAIAAKFDPQACVVTDIGILSDAQNYPMLKGTPLFVIYAMPSAKDPDVAAVAVQMEYVTSPEAYSATALGAVPLLVEKDTDLNRFGALVFNYWNVISKNLPARGK